MPILIPDGTPVVTATNKLVVDAHSLPPGVYRVTLVVEDASGVKSAPSTILIRITPKATG
jgi:hypothetical protein